MRHAALVTGSGRGIGLAIALQLADAGFNIAINDYADNDALDAAVAAVEARGVAAVKVPGEVSLLAGHGEMLDRAEAACGPLTTLVNNAGVSVLSRGDLLDVTFWQQHKERIQAGHVYDVFPYDPERRFHHAAH